MNYTSTYWTRIFTTRSHLPWIKIAIRIVNPPTCTNIVPNFKRLQMRVFWEIVRFTFASREMSRLHPEGGGVLCDSTTTRLYSARAIVNGLSATCVPNCCANTLCG